MVSYLFLKAFHIVGVVTWFAGLFYIFRLYVYHVENQANVEMVKVFEVMERRLYRGICWPSMIITTVFGVALIVIQPEIMRASWLHWKFLFLVILFGYHFYSGHIRKEFAKKNYKLTSKQCRLINEVPSVILIAIVLLAILKPL